MNDLHTLHDDQAQHARHQAGRLGGGFSGGLSSQVSSSAGWKFHGQPSERHSLISHTGLIQHTDSEYRKETPLLG
jgi:hypothetical protein